MADKTMKGWGHKWVRNGPDTSGGTPWHCEQCGATMVGWTDFGQICPESPREKEADADIAAGRVGVPFTSPEEWAALRRVEQALDVCKSAAGYAFLWNRIYKRISEEAPEALRILEEEVDQAGLPAVFMLGRVP